MAAELARARRRRSQLCAKRSVLKSMRRSAITSLMVAASCLAFAGTADAHHRKAPKLKKTSVCLGSAHRRHWRRIAADAEAEVYRGYEEQESLSVFGCMYGHEHYWLGVVPSGLREEGLPRARHMVLGGVMVAFESGEFGGSGTELKFSRTYIEVDDLRTGMRLYKTPTGTLTGSNPYPYSVGTGKATAIVVRPDGSVAWIAENYKETRATGSPYYQVHALDETGERLLASGDGVAPSSLALAGGTIYWTQEGRPESATLE